MKRSTRRFDKWRQGSSAAGDPSLGEFNSENAQVYENGTLGPRPGWRVHANAGSSTWESENLYGLGWYRETDDGGRLVVLYDDSGTPRFAWGDYDSSPGTVTWNASSALTNLVDTDHLNPPEYPDFNKVPVTNDGFVLSTLGGYVSKSDASSIGTPALPIPALTWVTAAASTTVFTLNDVSDLTVGDAIDIYSELGVADANNPATISAISGQEVTVGDAAAGTPSVGDLIVFDGTTLNDDGYPAGATVYRERAYYWGYASVPGRVYYSDPADYAHVGIFSFFDVAVDTTTLVGAVTGMWAVKNALLIARKDDRWLVLTGTSPENGTLRELGRDLVPNFLAATVVDNQLFFLNRNGQGVGVGTPSFIDTESLQHLSPTAYPASTNERPDNAFQPETCVGDEVGRFLFLPGRPEADSEEIVAVERVNGVFTLSRWQYTDGDYPEDIEFTPGRPNEMWAVVPEGSNPP